MTKVLMLGLLLISAPVLAHPGNTDEYGCHTNKKIGYYHCHNPKVNKYKPTYDLEKLIPAPQKFDKSYLFRKDTKIKTVKENNND